MKFALLLMIMKVDVFGYVVFENVFNYWCGKYTKIIYDSKNNHNIAAFDHLSMELWNWVRDEISTEQLKRAALNFKKAVM